MNLKSTLFFIVILAFSVINSAYADQCEMITADQAKSAANLIDTQKVGKILTFCQLCGATAPTEVPVTSVATAPDPFGPPKDYPEFNTGLMINGSEVDLAYTYVKISATTWVNLGLLANCNPFLCDINDLNAPCKLTNVSSVSQFITEKDGGYTPSPVY